jgi:hypothetical protein
VAEPAIRQIPVRGFPDVVQKSTQIFEALGITMEIYLKSCRQRYGTLSGKLGDQLGP